MEPIANGGRHRAGLIRHATVMWKSAIIRNAFGQAPSQLPGVSIGYANPTVHVEKPSAPGFLRILCVGATVHRIGDWYGARPFRRAGDRSHDHVNRS